MKISSFFAFVILFAACTSDNSGDKTMEGQASSQVVDTLPFPLWLEGNWRRLNDAEGEQTVERWSGLSNGKLAGEGLTLKGNDTLFHEILSLEYVDGALHYIVSGVNAEPTHFVCTAYSDTSLLFNNELNPFPKNIRYAIKGDTLKAVIDDGQGGNSANFLFVK
jgi:hypothetical protein